jgi:hypothetical protein
MLTIVSYGEGKCMWCCQHTEGVQTAFKDGLSGFLCKKDFWAALKARSEKAPQVTPEGSRKAQSSNEGAVARGAT